MPLPLRSCILCHPVAVQATLIANSNAMGIVALRVGADPLDRACGADITVAADVEMIACAIKTTEAVSGIQVALGKGAVLASGAAMDHN